MDTATVCRETFARQVISVSNVVDLPSRRYYIGTGIQVIRGRTMASPKLTEQLGYLIARTNRLIEDDLTRRLQANGIAVDQ